MTNDIMEGISPLPWSQKGTDERGVSTQRLIKNGEDSTVAVVCDKTHAAYIVHACNLYPELVEALEQCQESLHYAYCDVDQDDPEDGCVEECMEARAILAKCKAGSE